jgi:hypothetical protein
MSKPPFNNVYHSRSRTRFKPLMAGDNLESAQIESALAASALEVPPPRSRRRRAMPDIYHPRPWTRTRTSIFWSTTGAPRRERMPKTTMACLYFPQLIDTANCISHLSTGGVTLSWRNIVRCRLREEFSLEQILEKNLKDDTGRASILKEICHRELPDCIEKRKKSRNATRFELGKVGLRQSYPQDVINNIFTFTRFL